jgi:Uma2 family endonuclease
MLRSPSLHAAIAGLGEPVWEIVRLFPNQGDWSEPAYLDLANSSHHRIEFFNGILQVLETPHAQNLKPGEPSWDVAYLFPIQGDWSESDYLLLPSNERLELDDGRVESLPMPTAQHQDILVYLFELLKAFLKGFDPRARIFPASYPVRIGTRKFREPDILLVLSAHLERIGQQFCQQPDLVVEIVSPGNRDLDLETKRVEYAAAGIREYWIVDPQTRLVTVPTLRDGKYPIHGEFQGGTTATSPLLNGFTVNIDDMWRAGGYDVG